MKNILETSDYRSFIKEWINEVKKVKKFGYSDIARFGGFSARSFPRDVVNGTKRLTLISLPKFVKGLQLTGEISEYFRVLVEIEHKDCRTKHLDLLKLEEIRQRLKERILSRQDDTKTTKDSAFNVSSLPEVYAALGSLDKGASIKEIIERTTLSSFDIEAALQQMLKEGIAVRKKSRYFVHKAHLNLEGLKQSEIFKKHFVWSSERSSRMARVGLDSDSKLFLSSAFSVDQKDLPKLKEELRTVLLKFVDNSEKADGNKVVNIVASLF